MVKIKTKALELKGDNYKIGSLIGERIKNIPEMVKIQTSTLDGFTKREYNEAMKLFQEFCPGINEEIKGFADALHVSMDKILYYAMTYLHPNCSHIAFTPEITENNHPIIARNYEFNYQEEDFTLVKTVVDGKYTHIGTSVLNFGRDDGFNEHGLSVTMSSCGFPVGPLEFMRKPSIIGLQFWAVIRSVLENCKNVNEAINYMKSMPISYNLNLILVDKSGEIALVETLDGRMAVENLNDRTNKKYIHATNHPHIEDFVKIEPKAMRNSINRYNFISNYIDSELEKNKFVSESKIKKLLLNKYPDGLCCHYYKEFFGTTKSMIIDPVDMTIDICWGGDENNGWKRYNICDSIEYEEKDIELNFDKPDFKEFEFIDL